MKYLFRPIGYLMLLFFFCMPIIGTIMTVAYLIGATEDTSWEGMERFGLVAFLGVSQVFFSAYLWHAIGAFP